MARTRRSQPSRAGRATMTQSESTVLSRGAALDERADFRVSIEETAWLDVWGRVPVPQRSIQTVTADLSMSGVTLVWDGSLEVGQLVGLLLLLDGHPCATRARVIRQPAPGRWCFRFVHPTAALLHDIGRRVREAERQSIADARDESVPLTARG